MSAHGKKCSHCNGTGWIVPEDHLTGPFWNITSQACDCLPEWEIKDIPTAKEVLSLTTATVVRK